MPSTATRDRVVDLLTPVLAAEGLDLEDVELKPAGRRTVLRVVVDADGGVLLDRIAELSNQIAKLLDADDPMGAGSYTLEVTSRGVDRPLTAPRHWRRNVGRLVKVTTAEGEEVTGRITEADETGAELDAADPKSAAPGRITFDTVARAKVQIEFARPSDRADAPGEG
ncbi:ribosome maturation factor RimP [Tenggerimyces flavus]|uniref:Ribosome maturation factor RimP n=1 Tax=Tenggerimyces flavus TaxID=1708749 RepID=A0ABV7YAN3_9ACTN|nr:ribosome maturation factor RimP [Tenggerimyces flavus]MBM7786883.1 ribosome maturation factor RimP [Tenggerimyces flavus]